MTEKKDDVQQLFLTAVELSEERRESWLIEKCGDDQELLNEIRSLLKHDRPKMDPLESPLDEVIPEVEGLAVQGNHTCGRTHANPDAFHVRCPHCHNPIELLDEAPLSEIECPSCGSQFSLLGENPQSPGRSAPPAIANFKLRDPVGIGAFGAVWKAFDETLDRTVAVKIPRRGQLNATDAAQFLREARSVARLKHPNIVAVHEVGRDNNQIYIVTDFIDGSALSDWLSENSLTPKQAAELTCKIAAALHHAHDEGVIHRDLKPSNIMMDQDGEPHLVDFGLAKQDAGEITMTADGKILGTPAYMSPEQARGEAHRSDARSDVYSLGVVLFEMLTGERPFRGDHRMLLQQVLHDDPWGPRRFNTSVPRDLDTICLKCLQKDPGRRYHSAAALAEDLRNWQASKPIKARPVTSVERFGRWCQRNPKVAALSAAVFLLLMIVAVTSTISSIRLSVAHNEVGAAHKKTRQALFDLYTRQGIVASERGDHALASLWFVNASTLSKDEKSRHDASRIRAREFGGLSPRPIAMFWHDGELLSELEIAPSDQHLSTLTDRGRCTVWDITNQTPIILQHGSSSMAWSPDQRHFAIGMRDGGVLLYECDHWSCKKSIFFRGPITALEFCPKSQQLAIGGDVVRLWDVEESCFSKPAWKHHEAARFFSFDSDGLRLAVAYENELVKVFDLDSSDAAVNSRTFPHATRNFDDYPFNGALFINDGETLVTNHSKTMFWSDLERPDRVNALTTRHQVDRSAVSPDGRYLATCGPENLQLWDTQTAEEVPWFGKSSRHVSDVSFSPDGKVLVTADRDGNVELLSLPRPNASVTRLQHAGWVRFARISKNARQLATGQTDGLVRVWNLERESPSVIPVRIDGSHTRLKLNRDGTKFLITGSSWWHGTLNYARVYDAATGQPLGPKLDTGSILIDAAFSPDGTQVVTSNIDNHLQTWDWRRDKQPKSTVSLPLEPRAIDYDPLGKKLIVICTSGLMQFRDAKTMRLLAERRHGDGVIHAVRGSRDSNKYYDPNSRKPWFRGEGVYEGTCLTFSEDSRWLVTTTFDRNVEVWDLTTMDRRYDPLRCDVNVFDAGLSADQSLLVSLSGSEARVWDFTSGKLLQTLAHPTKLCKVRFDPTGRHVLTACEDGEARLWNWEEGVLACPPMKHEDRVHDAVFLPNSNWIMTSGRDSTVRVWDPDGGQPLCPSIRIAGDGRQILFSSTGSHALIATSGNDSRVVNVINLNHLVRTHVRSHADEKRWAEMVAGRRIVRAGEVVLTTNEILQRWEKPEHSGIVPGHLDAARDCLRQRNWSGARREYRAVLRRQPIQPLIWLKLLDVTWWEATTNGRSIKDTKAILAEARKTIGDGHPELCVEVGHAMWCLRTGQQEEYERVCRLVLKRHLDSGTPRTQFQVANILALGEQSLVPPDRISEIARRAIEAEPSAGYFHSALARSLIRAGRYEEALASSDGEAALTALGFASMGNDSEARRFLEIARKVLAGTVLDPSSTWYPTKRLAWQLYLQDTEHILAER